MKGPRRARMPVYGAGSKCLGRTEKETEWLRFHAPEPPGNSHCAPTGEGRKDSPFRVEYLDAERLLPVLVRKAA